MNSGNPALPRTCSFGYVSSPSWLCPGLEELEDMRTWEEVGISPHRGARRRAAPVAATRSLGQRKSMCEVRCDVGLAVWSMKVGVGRTGPHQASQAFKRLRSYPYGVFTAVRWRSLSTRQTRTWIRRNRMRGAGGTREALRASLPGEHAVDCGSRFEGPVHAKVEQWIFGTGLSANGLLSTDTREEE